MVNNNNKLEMELINLLRGVNSFNNNQETIFVGNTTKIVVFFCTSIGYLITRTIVQIRRKKQEKLKIAKVISLDKISDVNFIQKVFYNPDQKNVCITGIFLSSPFPILSSFDYNKKVILKNFHFDNCLHSREGSYNTLNYFSNFLRIISGVLMDDYKTIFLLKFSKRFINDFDQITVFGDCFNYDQFTVDMLTNGNIHHLQHYYDQENTKLQYLTNIFQILSLYYLVKEGLRYLSQMYYKRYISNFLAIKESNVDNSNINFPLCSKCNQAYCNLIILQCSHFRLCHECFYDLQFTCILCKSKEYNIIILK